MQKLEEVELEKLYPLDSIESFTESQVENEEKNLEDGNNSPIVSVIQYNGIYLILEGVHKVIAYARLGKKKIHIQLVDRNKLGFWSDDSNISSHLKYLGKNALYDFEAMTGIKYPVYPREYMGEK